MCTRLTSRSQARSWGYPPWSPARENFPEPVIAYSVGDLKTLPAKTTDLLVDYKEIEDEDLAPLARFKNLRSLNIGTCEYITDKGLRHLGGLKKLEALVLSGEHITGAGFVHLCDLTSLAALNLYESGKIGDAGIAFVSKMKQLRKLGLFRASALTDAQLGELCKLAELRELDVRGCEKITDKGLECVAALSKLEYLRYSASPQTAVRGIASLARLKKLKIISLDGMSLRDDTLLPLTQIKSLEEIYLDAVDITGKGVRKLLEMKNLKWVNIQQCETNVVASVLELKPSLKSFYFHDWP